MTPHNKAAIGEIAPTVLLPGDPDRAAWMASSFLTDAREVTSVRGMRGFTGTYRNERVSVMSSGMGGPSAGIYSYELYTHYKVESIIRIGTCGGFSERIVPGDLILALTASTDGNWAHQYRLHGSYSPPVDFPLLETALGQARKLGFRIHAGMIFSSDLFSSYNALGEQSWKAWSHMGAIAQDMETYALYSIAAYMGKRALSILTMTDCCVTGASLDDRTRMEAMGPMARVALETAHTAESRHA